MYECNRKRIQYSWVQQIEQSVAERVIKKIWWYLFLKKYLYAFHVFTCSWCPSRTRNWKETPGSSQETLVQLCLCVHREFWPQLAAKFDPLAKADSLFCSELPMFAILVTQLHVAASAYCQESLCRWPLSSLFMWGVNHVRLKCLQYWCKI